MAASIQASSRLCLSNNNIPGVLGSILNLCGANNYNIVSQSNRARGNIAFSVLDIVKIAKTDSPRSAASSATTLELEQLRASILNIKDVITCDFGHFNRSVQLSLNASSNSRFCIINQNVPGVLGKISSLLGTMSLNISSQRNKSHGANLASTVIVLDATNNATNNDDDDTSSVLKQAALALRSIDGVLSADIGSFTPGSLAQLSSSHSDSIDAHQVDYYTGGGGNGGGSSQVLDQRTATLTVMSERNTSTLSSNQLVIVMVGLPARGKSFTARKLAGFLSWGMNTNSKIFNAGKYRRKVQEEVANEEGKEQGEQEQQPKQNHNKPETPTSPASRAHHHHHHHHHHTKSSFNASENGAASYFSADNIDATVQREQAADRALDDILSWFFKQPAYSSNCAIFDATNSTRSRRNHIVNKFKTKEKVQVVFLEVICDDSVVLHENISNKVKSSPDYHGMSLQDALLDFKERIRNYTLQYEPIDSVLDQHLSYMQCKNLGNHVVLNNIYGRIASTFVPYLMALHVGRRPLWFLCVDHLSRTNLSQVVASLFEWLRTAIWLRSQDIEQVNDGNVKGDGDEDEDGEEKRLLLAPTPAEAIPVYTSSEDLHVQLAVSLCKKTRLSNQSASQMSSHYIEHFIRDELRTPSQSGTTQNERGRTDRRMCVSLVPMVIELEQQTTPTLVLANTRCIRGLMAYFLRKPIDQIEINNTGVIKESGWCSGGGYDDSLPAQVGTIVELTPSQGGSWQDTRHNLG
jgi:hypothetical protein